MTSTEAGIELPPTISRVVLPETPPAPKGWMKLKSASELAVCYIRTGAQGVVDMIVAQPDNVVIIGSDGNNKVKLNVAVVGMVGGEQFRGRVEDSLESILAQLSAS